MWIVKGANIKAFYTIHTFRFNYGAITETEAGTEQSSVQWKGALRNEIKAFVLCGKSRMS